MQFTMKNLALLAGAASLTSALPTQQMAKRTFNADGGNNLAVWWGNSATTTPLSTICQGSSDIVILTFATAFTGGKWTVLGSGTASQSDIKACQAAGKKVFMSIGGATGAITWASAADATTAAKAAVKQFYDGMGLDGIDLDIENKAPANWDAFAKALKTSGKYVSAAPQCPSPDASLPFSVLDEVDMTWVQFYNNGDCNHGASGFMDSVKSWSSNLKNSKLYIAAPGSSTSAGSGYISPSAMQAEIAAVQALKLSNFGGYALWDASTSYANSDYGSVVKKALGGSSAGSPSSPVSSAAASAAPSATGGGHQKSAAPSATGGAHQESAAASATGSPATGTPVNVQATSTAVVTSTAFANSAAPTAAAPHVPTAAASGVPTAAATAAVSSAAAAAPASGSSAGTSCSTAGGIVCSSDGSKYGICSNGSPTMMAVAPGTKCSDGKIVAA